MDSHLLGGLDELWGPSRSTESMTLSDSVIHKAILNDLWNGEE